MIGVLKNAVNSNQNILNNLINKLMCAHWFSSLAIHLSNEGFPSKFKFARNFMLS